jgi:molybdenum cofactor cytidylyltransferase
MPMVAGQRGNPILLDDEARGQILASEANLGCRHFVQQHPEHVHVHASANTRFITDLDTLDDVQVLAQRTGWRLDLPELGSVG